MIGNFSELTAKDVKEVKIDESEISAFVKKLDSGIKSFDIADRPLTDKIEKISTRNEHLEGKIHPKTGVEFESRIVENCNNDLVEVVVPKFKSICNVQLPENLYMATDRKQFYECNNKLKEEILKNSELKKIFNEEQLEQIDECDTPDGYIWHHDADKGKMQLVVENIHGATGHTGGKVIWGGGNENR